MCEKVPCPGALAPGFSVEVETAARMQALGERIGRAMRTGDVLALVGDLGSGKTTLAQGVARGLGVRPDRHVASPTFALVCQHPGRVPFVHADFYRIRNPAELAELGLEEAFDEAASAVEWADRFPDAMPADHVEITFAVSGGRRVLHVRATGTRSRELAHALVG